MRATFAVGVWKVPKFLRSRERRTPYAGFHDPGAFYCSSDAWRPVLSRS